MIYSSAGTGESHFLSSSYSSEVDESSYHIGPYELTAISDLHYTP